MLIYDCDAPQLVVYDFWWRPLAKFQCVEDLMEKTKLTREEVSHTMNTSSCVLGLRVEFDRGYVDNIVRNEGRIEKRHPMRMVDVGEKLGMSEPLVRKVIVGAINKLRGCENLQRLIREGAL